jgi:NAD(P)-dependent dehydrogenase (short-subunit alcohol dehydrogenase family)
MGYLVTGATGFIGRFLVPRLLRRGQRVHLLVREGSAGKLDRLRREWGADAELVVGVVGDVTEERLGLGEEQLEQLRGEVSHVVHLAADYNFETDPNWARRVNVGGTRNVCGAAETVQAGTLHHVSSIAAAGRYPGRFTEEMFDEAVGLENAYFRTKHDAERVVREEYAGAWRIYRPGIVVGSSRTGETDKVDGPYHFFPAIRRLSKLPAQLPLVGIEGGRVYVVPVDFVADALDHLMHADGWDGRAFHLVEREAPSVGEVLNAFCRAAGAPTFPVRVDLRATRAVPRPLRNLAFSLPPVHRTRNALMHALGVPREPLNYVLNPTRFDTANTEAALADSQIECPRLEEYADLLWRYWEDHLAADHEQSVPGLLGRRDRFTGRVALVTGASSGIGREAALQLAERGCRVLLVARSAEDLETLAKHISAEGGEAHAYPADLSDTDDVARVVRQVLADHRRVDILVNNAGMSIRRSVALSYDRLHDFQRTIQLNYFGALRLMLGLLPGMRERGDGHIINISSIGVQTNAPRFSAYVASKAALDAFSRSVATEVVDDGVAITTIYMPLVRTPMIEPTRLYKSFPALSPAEAAGKIVAAVEERPKRVATPMGATGQVLYAVAPRAADVIANFGYHLMPDSAAARGESYARDEGLGLVPERRAFSYLFRGIHW